MTLQRQTLSVPIGVGQSEKEAAPYIQGNASTVNVHFDKNGRAAKRRGAETLADNGSDSPNGLLPVDGTVHVNGRDGSFRYDPQIGELVRQNKTEPRASQAKISSVLRGRRFACLPSVAVVANTMCVVWSDTEVPHVAARAGHTLEIDKASVWAAFYDISGEECSLLSMGRVDGYVRSAHVVGLDTGSGTRCFVIVGETSRSAMRWDRYTLTAEDYTFTGGAAFALGRIANDVTYDVCGIEDPYNSGNTPRAYAVWPTALGTQVYSVNAAGTVTSLTITTAGRLNGIAICHNSQSSQVWIGQADGAYYSYADTLGGAAISTGTVTIPADLQIQRVVMGTADGSTSAVFACSGRFIAYTDGSGTPIAWGSYIRRITPGSGPTTEIFVPNLVLTGKPRTFSAPTLASSSPTPHFPMAGFSSRRCFLVAIEDLNSSTAVSADLAPYLVASYGDACFNEANVWNDGEALWPGAENGTNWTVPLVMDSDGDWHTVYPVATEVTAASATLPGYAALVSALQLDHVRIRVGQIAPRRSTTAADLAIFVGGAGAACADGQYTADLTPQRPDPIQNSGKASDVVVSYTDTSTDEFSFSVIWGWTDMQGREHRSAESDQLTAVWDSLWYFSGGSVTPWLMVAPIPMFASVFRQDAKTLWIDVVQSAANDPEDRYIIGRLYAPDADSDFPDCVVIILDPTGTLLSPAYPNSVVKPTRTPGSSSLSRPYTYTNLEAEAPAALVDITSTQNRLWALSASSRFSVLCTKPIETSIAPEFNSTLSVDVPQEGGDCIGLAALDDKIVVFKDSRVYVIVGEPGDSTGARSTIQRPRLVSGDVGCTNAASIVEGPFGVAFMSTRGPMLLTRGLEFQAIGERVQDTVAGKRAVGSIIPTDREVRWMLVTDNDGERWTDTYTSVVWDYDVDQWSKWSPDLIADYAKPIHQIESGERIYLLAGGELQEETTTPTAWSAAYWGAAVSSPWIRLADVEGFARVWRLTSLLYYWTGHVYVDLAYDYDDAVAETHTFLESVITPLRAANGRTEISVRPTRQKCSAVRFTIREEAVSQSLPTPTVGEGISLVSVDAEIGVKSGTARRRLADSAKR